MQQNMATQAASKFSDELKWKIVESTACVMKN